MEEVAEDLLIRIVGVGEIPIEAVGLIREVSVTMVVVEAVRGRAWAG